MGGAVQHPFMLPVPDGLHGLRGMVTGVLRLFDMANGHFVEPIGMAQLLTAEVGVGAGVLRVLPGVLDGLTGVLPETDRQCRCREQCLRRPCLQIQP